MILIYQQMERTMKRSRQDWVYDGGFQANKKFRGDRDNKDDRGDRDNRGDRVDRDSRGDKNDRVDRSDKNEQQRKQLPQQMGKLSKFIKDKKMQDILIKKGVKYLFPVQFLTFDCIFKGQDMIVRDKTGSGKTLAFGLPIIERLRQQKMFDHKHLPKFLIVLPTRQLAIQVKDQLQSLRYTDETDFRVIAVYGKSDINSQIQRIKRGIDVLVGTPGRLIDLLQRDVVKMNELQAFCLDEADQMLKQGFKEDIEKIYKYITDNAPKKTQNLLFSATIPQWLRDLSDQYLDKNCKYISLIKQEELSTPQKLKHMCLRLSKGEEYAKAKVISNVLKKYACKSGNSIIFCQRKADVQRLASSLRDYGTDGEALHSDVPQYKRQKVYRDFKAGQLHCIIATNVAARGLDFPQIDVVIQAQPPNNVQPYIHRSGRTARKGRDGICITLYSDNTERLIKNIEREARIKMIEINSRDIQGRDQGRDYGRDQERDYKRSSSRNDRTEDDEDLQLYVKYLPKSDSESDIRSFFEKKGVKLRGMKLLKTSQGESKGCCFLKFSSREDQRRCLDLDGQECQGNSLSISLPNKR